MMNENVTAANDKITALATASVAVVLVGLVAFAPEVLQFGEFALTAVVHAIVTTWDFQMALAIRIGSSVAWLVTLQWL